MKTTITGRKLDVSDRSKEKIEKKLSKFGRFFDEDAQTNVTLSNDVKNKIRVEVTIVNRGTIFRAQESSEDMMHALDETVEALERQIRKYKTKLEKRMRPAAYETVDFLASEVQEEKEFEIVRTKHFPVKPMSTEEAILQMNLLGHTFFAFRNAETGDISVVYCRKDGRYGLLEPGEAED